jgi:hypothetical protein
LHWASSQDEQFLQLSASLKERCLCLEQVLCNGLDEARFDKIQKCDLTVIDSGLASKAMGKSIDAFRNALVTEIRALRSNSGALLRRS